ncbi:MAG TPA: hypothetical protein PLO50_02675 [Nitrospira sp.]|nr:hypothetical protein [Nitrospira sp.]
MRRRDIDQKGSTKLSLKAAFFLLAFRIPKLIGCVGRRLLGGSIGMAVVYWGDHDGVSDHYRSYWSVKTREFEWYQEVVG